MFVPFEIDAFGYAADIFPDLDDFFAGDEHVATFDTSGLVIGDEIRFDVTDFLSALLEGDHVVPLGIALRQTVRDFEASLIEFGNFRLVQVNEPPSGALLGMPVALMWLLRRRRADASAWTRLR